MRRSVLILSTTAVFVLSGASFVSAWDGWYGYPPYSNQASYTPNNYMSQPSPYQMSPQTSPYSMPTYYSNNYSYPSNNNYSQPSYAMSSYYNYSNYSYPQPSYQMTNYGGYDPNRFTFSSGYYGTCNGQPCGGAFYPNSPYYGGFAFPPGASDLYGSGSSSYGYRY